MVCHHEYIFPTTEQYRSQQLNSLNACLSHMSASVQYLARSLLYLHVIMLEHEIYYLLFFIMLEHGTMR